jgi:hypothetical protein
MSIYCYINGSLKILSSINLEKVNTIDEFRLYIITEFDLDNTHLICYHNFSTLQLINILESNDKVHKNYLVTTNNDINTIRFFNLNTLYNTNYDIPKMMTIDEFKKNFIDNNKNNIEIYCKAIQLKSDEHFIPENTYYYKFVSKN